MPGVAARGGSRRRRTMNEINMVPFIDVMLVLLIIFMVSAPLITTGTVDLPSVGKSSQRPDKVIEVIVGKDEKLKLKINGEAEERSLALGDLRERVLSAQDGDANVPVVISADRQVKYESVVQVMDRLQRAGVQRVGLSVKQGG
jgi:biopolymer transport protein TolR